jgi:hypothetical protein
MSCSSLNVPKEGILRQRYQKYNRFPRMLELGNKVKEANHTRRVALEHGEAEFPFLIIRDGQKSAFLETKTAACSQN